MVVTEGMQVLDRLGKSRAPDGEHCCGPSKAGASEPVGAEGPLDGRVRALVRSTEKRPLSSPSPETQAANLEEMGRPTAESSTRRVSQEPAVALAEMGMHQVGSGGQSGQTPPQKPRAVISRIALLGLIESQGYRCALTGRQLKPETASLDHKVPLGRGGEHAIENIWIVHEDVNRAKGTMTAEEFVALCHEVVSYQEGVGPHGKH